MHRTMQLHCCESSRTAVLKHVLCRLHPTAFHIPPSAFAHTSNPTLRYGDRDFCARLSPHKSGTPLFIPIRDIDAQDLFGIALKNICFSQALQRMSVQKWPCFSKHHGKSIIASVMPRGTHSYRIHKTTSTRDHFSLCCFSCI